MTDPIFSHASEEPIHDASQDTLNRDPFATMAARLIDGIAVSEVSTVFALVGPWGSGKTSLWALISSHLENVSSVSFNPWMSSHSADIIAEFVAVLAEALPKKGKLGQSREALLKFGSRAAPVLSMIPYVGGFLGALAGGARNEQPEESLQSTFAELEVELRKLKQPI